jgi:hypothetical protein
METAVEVCKESDRMPRAIKSTVLAVGALGIALPVAGCGSSPNSGVAHLSSRKGTSPSSSEGGISASENTTRHQQREIAYARCLRSHGVPDVPEPDAEHSIVNGLGGDPHQGPQGPPQLQAAEKQCSSVLPPGGPPSPQIRDQMEERALRFGACMRSHGEPDFPDPRGVRGFVRIGGPGSGVDPNSPQFGAAAKACKLYLGPAGSQGEPGAPPSGGSEESVAGSP